MRFPNDRGDRLGAADLIAAQGFAPHRDTHDVFVLQITGTKRSSGSALDP